MLRGPSRSPTVTSPASHSTTSSAASNSMAEAAGRTSQSEPRACDNCRLVGCVAEIGVHEAVPDFEIQVEGVEHPAGPGKCLEFAAGTAQDVPESIARRAKPAAWNRRCCGNDVGQTFIWNDIK